MKEKLAEFIDDAIQGTDIFLVKLTVDSNNDINILLDSDSNLTLNDCKKISRVVSSRINIEEKFSLTVSSAGVGEPLIFRQFKKNIGRKVRVTLNNGEVIEAKLIGANDESIDLESNYRDKKMEKGKTTLVHQRSIEYKNIDKTVVLIRL